MDQVRQYLLTLCAASAVCAVINTIFEARGNIQKVIKLLCGMFVALCAISPLLNIGGLDLNTITDKMSLETTAVDTGKSIAAEYTGEFIKEQVAAYVLDKAATLDLCIDVEVELDNSTPPKPCGIIMKGAASPYAKEVLGRYIDNTLGIPKEGQSWE